MSDSPLLEAMRKLSPPDRLEVLGILLTVFCGECGREHCDCTQQAVNRFRRQATMLSESMDDAVTDSLEERS